MNRQDTVAKKKKRISLGPTGRLDVGAGEADGHSRLADNHPVVLGLIERIIDGLATLANGDDDAGAARRPDRRPQTTTPGLRGPGGLQLEGHVVALGDL